MSHSILSMNAQDPNRAGEITAALNDLSDVSASSPSNNDMLVFGGSNYAPVADALTPQSARGTGGSVVSASAVIYSNPNPYLAASDPNRLFWETVALQQGSGLRMTVVNTSDVSFRVNTYGATRWMVGFNLLTAGVYSLRATCHIGALSADSEYIDCSWTDLSYNKLGPITRFSTRGNKRNTMRGMIDAAANDVAGFYIDGLSSGVYYNQANYIDVFIEVERLA